MKTRLLLSIVSLAVIGTVQSYAACTITPDCESLGYKYTQKECLHGSVACPFDNTKYFCFAPCTSYTYTAETCADECKNVGSDVCIRNGVTYYKSCGSSLCSSEQTCNNGTCVSPVAKSGYCCGYSVCGFSGTSNSSDSFCQRNYGRSCYQRCKSYGYPDCNDMQASCRASGGTPVFQFCDTSGYYYDIDFSAGFACQ